MNEKNSWNSQFKQKNAALKQQQTSSNVTTSKLINAQDIKHASPIPYLESRGFIVKKVGSGYSVLVDGDEYYRLDNTRSGWLWCDQYGNRGGDNIDLVHEIEGKNVKFKDAVALLNAETGALVTVSAVQLVVTEKVCEFKENENKDNQKYGRLYLIKRGISQKTIEHAEKQRFLDYTYGAIVFVGKSNNVIKSATLRYYTNTKQDQTNKRDVKGSVKAYAPILHGDPASRTVWIVEGGTDALALHDIAMREHKPRPTVIVSGGAGARAFIDIPHIQSIIKQLALKIVIALDNEKDEETQIKTNAAHQKQRERLADLCNVVAQTWMPPEGFKDLAELNALQATQ